MLSQLPLSPSSLPRIESDSDVVLPTQIPFLPPELNKQLSTLLHAHQLLLRNQQEEAEERERGESRNAIAAPLVHKQLLPAAYLFPCQTWSANGIITSETYDTTQQSGVCSGPQVIVESSRVGQGNC
jgi:hypothetical protein